MAQDAIALFLEVPVRSVQVELSINVAARLRADLDEVEDLRVKAEVAAANYAMAIRALVGRLNPKYSMRDIAMLTGVSFQRVGQPARRPARSRSTREGRSPGFEEGGLLESEGEGALVTSVATMMAAPA